MSTNHHTPIVPGAPAAASTINTPLGELDSALSGLITGSAGMEVLRLVEQEQEANGAISRMSSLMVLKAPTPLTQGSVTSITGGSDGDLVALRAYPGHKILLSQGVSTNQLSLNIRTSGWLPLRENRYTIFIRSGGLWREVSMEPDWNTAGTITNGTRPQRIVVPRNGLTRDGVRENMYLHYVPSMGVRNWAAIRASGTSFQSIGLAAPTTTGTIVSANDDNGNWSRATSGATAGNAAGVNSDYSVTRFGHQPRFEITIKTDTTVGNIRLWAGLFHANPPNSDTLAGAGIGFRYSTAAADPNWMAIMHNGTSQVLELDTGVAVNADTIYTLSVRDYEDGPYFCINGTKIGSTPISWPTPSTDLGMAVRIITQTGAARVVNISRLYVEHN